MRMLVTGAGGFIGRATVAAAAARGHHVRAMLRTGAAVPSWAESGDDGVIEVVRGDVLDPEAVLAAVGGVEVVVHLAAAMRGGLEQQMAVAVDGTRNLLDAMLARGVPRLVAVSSIAVYDVLQGGAARAVDESCPLETHPEQRDAYCAAKLAMEALVRARTGGDGPDAVILRPGVVHGPERPWSPRVGFRPSPRLWLIPRGRATLPLVSVQRCAEAIVLAATRTDVHGPAFNVVEDDPPARIAYARRIAAMHDPRPRLLEVPWIAVRVAGGLARGLRRVRRGRRTDAGPFSPRRLAARFTPRPYAAAAIRRQLGWAAGGVMDDALGGIEGAPVGGR